MSQVAVEEPQVRQEEEIVTFWDITRHQFAKNKPAMTALWLLILTIILAIAAPLITMNAPYLMKVDGKLSWPLFDQLFNRLVFKSAVDIFFNLILVLLPIWLLGSMVIRASGLEGKPNRLRILLAGIPLALLLGFYVTLTVMGRPSMDTPPVDQPVYIQLLLLVAFGFSAVGLMTRLARSQGSAAQRSFLVVAGGFLLGLLGISVAMSLAIWPQWKMPHPDHPGQEVTDWAAGLWLHLVVVAAPWTAAVVAGWLALRDPRPRRQWAVLLGAALTIVLVLAALLYVKHLQERQPPIYIWLVAGALTALGWMAFQSARVPGLLPRQVRALRLKTRVGLTGFFLGGFVIVLTIGEFTAPVVGYRDVIADAEKAGGWALQPPIFNHPDNTGEPTRIVGSRFLKPPSWKDGLLLGTDNNGRDVFSRILFGTRISLTIGIIAVSIYATIGTILGSIAGYVGGRTDMFILFLVMVMICIPSLFLMLTIVAVFEDRSIFLIMMAIALVSWTGITRLVRGEFLRQRSIDYVTAARALGIPERRIIFGHILKNAMSPVLVAVAFGIAGAILAESFISFIGLGDLKAPTWGQTLKDGREQDKMWLILAPGTAIFFVVTILNLVGDGLRDALDPKLRQ